ncbi:MAG: zinc-finger domain-containing protein [Phaeospirillum sp.]|nr:zinc-finger domain-containing protein [Phaeospirillum sp.]
MTAATVSKSGVETITVSTGKVACEGNAAEGLGHPRVYLDLTAHGEIVCPYCSRTYVLAAGAKVGHH